jgi:hypothetical protein
MYLNIFIPLPFKIEAKNNYPTEGESKPITAIKNNSTDLINYMKIITLK